MSAIKLPIVLLVVLPVILTGFQYLYQNQPTLWMYEGSREISFYQTDLIFILPFIYAFSPLMHSAKKYFEKKGPENAIFELKCVKKIVYVEISLLIIITAATLGYNSSEQYSVSGFLTIFGPNLQYPVLAGLIWMTIQSKRKD